MQRKGNGLYRKKDIRISIYYQGIKIWLLTKWFRNAMASQDSIEKAREWFGSYSDLSWWCKKYTAENIQHRNMEITSLSLTNNIFDEMFTSHQEINADFTDKISHQLHSLGSLWSTLLYVRSIISYYTIFCLPHLGHSKSIWVFPRSPPIYRIPCSINHNSLLNESLEFFH